MKFIESDSIKRNYVNDDVVKDVKTYFQLNLPQYEVVDIVDRSYHKDDCYLFMVVAKKNDGSYAVWTCWNESTKCLNYGHYDLINLESCKEILNEYYYRDRG